MNTTVHNNSTVQFTFFLVMRLNIIPVTKRVSLIVILNPFELFIYYLFILSLMLTNLQMYEYNKTV